MDKETLSNYGWIVICVLVLAVMLAFATPFGTFVAGAVKSTTQGLFDVNQNALDSAGIEIMQQEFEEMLNGGQDGVGDLNGAIIPEGGTYYVGVTSTTIGDYTGATTTLTAGDSFPETANTGDVYVYGNYEYRYKQKLTSTRISFVWNDNSVGDWGVRCISNVAVPGSILNNINGKPITNLNYTFYGCTSLTTAPVIPSSVTDMSYTFSGCTSLTTAPVIPSSVTNMTYTFYGCTLLTGEILISCSSQFNKIIYSSCPARMAYYHIDGCDGSCGK